MISGFVYKWTNLVNNKWYIGSHGGSPDDNYVGSGTAFNKSVEKYGIESFHREIVYEGSDYIWTEDFYLKLLNVKDDRTSYNLKNAAIGFEKGYVQTKEHREKLSLARRCHKETARYKISKAKRYQKTIDKYKALADKNNKIAEGYIKIRQELLDSIE